MKTVLLVYNLLVYVQYLSIRFFFWSKVKNGFVIGVFTQNVAFRDFYEEYRNLYEVNRNLYEVAVVYTKRTVINTKWTVVYT